MSAIKLSGTPASPGIASGFAAAVVDGRVQRGAEAKGP